MLVNSGVNFFCVYKDRESSNTKQLLTETSRRHIYGSKITKELQSVKYFLLQYPFEEKLKKNPIFFKFFNFFWSPVSRIVPKQVKWGPLEVF